MLDVDGQRGWGGLENWTIFMDVICVLSLTYHDKTILIQQLFKGKIFITVYNSEAPFIKVVYFVVFRAPIAHLHFRAVTELRYKEDIKQNAPLWNIDMWCNSRKCT